MSENAKTKILLGENFFLTEKRNEENVHFATVWKVILQFESRFLS